MERTPARGVNLRLSTSPGAFFRQVTETLTNALQRPALNSELSRSPSLEATSSSGNDRTVASFLDNIVNAAVEPQLQPRETTEGYFQRLKEFSGGKKVCGAVWKQSETAYKCRTCEMDPTCAICVDCFDPEVHAGHDYNIIRTAGGCCDCGDIQAWKPSGFCKNHRGYDENDNPVSYLPKALAVNLRAVVRGALLCLSRMLPAAISPDAENRKKSVCIAQEILKWLVKLCTYGDGPRRIVCEEVKRPSSDSGPEGGVFEELMAIERMPASFQEDLNSLYFQLLMDLPFKETFLRVFIRHYHRLNLANKSYAEEERRRGPETRNTNPERIVPTGVFHLSVQLFTIPSLTPSFVQDGHLLDTLLATLKDTLIDVLLREPPPPPTPPAPDSTLTPTTATTPPPPPPTTEQGPIVIPRVVDADKVEKTQYVRVIYDIKYALAHLPVAQYVIYGPRPGLFASIIDIISVMQFMNPQERVITVHVEREPDSWAHAVDLEIESLQSIGDLWVGMRAGDPYEPNTPILPKLQRPLRCLVKVMNDWFATPGRAQREANKYSFHLPFQRVLSALIQESIRLLSPQCSLEDLFYGVVDPYDSFFKNVADQLLRLQYCAAQIKAGMWVRNGRSPLVQYILYYGVQYGNFEMDLVTLQTCAIMLGPEAFVTKALSCWGLDSWFTFEEPRVSVQTDSIAPQLQSLAEDFLLMLVRIVSERSRLGMPEAQVIRREIIQRLAVEDQTHSSLVKNVPKYIRESKHFEGILKEVSTYRRPDHLRMDSGKYELKQECWAEYDRYCLRYTRKDHQAAEDRYINYCNRHLSGRPELSPLPDDSTLLPAFAPLPRSLSTRKIHALLFSVVHNSLIGSTRCSDAMLTHALRLLTLIGRSESRQSATAESINSSQPEPIRNAREVKFTSDSLVTNAHHEIQVPSRDGYRTETLKDALVALSTSGHCSNYQKREIHEALVYIGGGADTGRARASVLGEIANRMLTGSEIPTPQPAETSTSTSTPSPTSTTSTTPLPSDPEAREKFIRNRKAAILAQMAKQREDFLLKNVEEHGGASTSNSLKETSRAHEEKLVCAVCKQSSAEPEKRPIAFIALVQRSKLVALERTQANRSLFWEAPQASPSTSTPAPECSNPLPSSSRSAPIPFPRQDDMLDEEWWVGDSDDDGMDADGLMQEVEMGLLAHVAMGNAGALRPLDDDNNNDESQHRVPRGGEREDGDFVFLEAHPEEEGSDDEEEMEEEGEEEEEGIARQLQHAVEEIVVLEEQGTPEAIPLLQPENTPMEDGEAAPAMAPETPELPDFEKINTVTSGTGVHVTFCGHEIHVDCFDLYFSSLLSRHSMLRSYEGDRIINLERLEFLCPICRRLANALVPLVDIFSKPPELIVTANDNDAAAFSFADTSSINNDNKPAASDHHSDDQVTSSPPTTQPNSNSSPLDSAVETLGNVVTCIAHDRNIETPPDDRSRLVPYLWDVLGYTIACREIEGRSDDGSWHLPPSLQRLTPLRSLVRCAARLGSFKRDDDNNHLLNAHPLDLILSFAASSHRKIPLAPLLKAAVKRFSANSASSPSSSSTPSSGVPLTTLLLPLLRQAWIFTSILGSDNDAGSILLEQPSLSEGEDEFTALCTRLHLPPRDVILSWAHQSLREYQPVLAFKGDEALLKEPKPYHLVPLPSAFEVLFKATLQTKCKKCEEKPSQPAICLLCGELVCLSPKCLRTNILGTGACTLHAQQCGGGIGVFLFPKMCNVYLLRESRRSPVGSPYLDKYGEEDPAFQRGRPLFLFPPRYEALERLVVSHSIDHEFRILESTTLAVHYGNNNPL